MKIQIPAEGIMQSHDWSKSKVYRVACECGASEHDHHVWVEADDRGEVSVTVYTTVRSNWWSKDRWHAIWSLLTKGYVDTESTLIMNKQQAFNYAHTLLSAVEDVEKFKEEQNAER